ncbi:MAG: single-stranded DNA-binding protein [Candidatus Nanopelagicales bacterium]
MYSTTTVTIQGNLTEDVRLRTTRAGKVWCQFRIAATERIRDRDSQQWSDGATAFYTVKCWNRLAENAAASLGKGMPVLVTGRLGQRHYERELGNRTFPAYVCEITASSVGPDLSRGVSTFRRTKSDAVVRAEERAMADAASVLDGVRSEVGSSL